MPEPIEEIAPEPAPEPVEEVKEEPVEETSAEEPAPEEPAEEPAEEPITEEPALEEEPEPEEEIEEIGEFELSEEEEEPAEAVEEEPAEEAPVEEPIEEAEEVEEEKEEPEEEEDFEDVMFELADGEEDEGEEEDDVEDVSFELAEGGDEDEDEDVTFELVEEEKEEDPLDKHGEALDYDAVDLTERYVTLKKHIRGFVAKMKQGNPERKEYYSEIKSALMALGGVKTRDSFSGETFYKGRTSLVKSRIRGKTLCLFFALNVDDYKQTVYHQQYKGETKAYADTPMMIRVRSEQGLQRALRLIDEIARVYSLKTGEKKSFRKDFNFEETADLIEQGLIKTRLVSVPYYEAQEILKKQNKQ